MSTGQNQIYWRTESLVLKPFLEPHNRVHLECVLTRKEQFCDSCVIAERTFKDAVKAGKRFVAQFGKSRVGTDLIPNDFVNLP